MEKSKREKRPESVNPNQKSNKSLLKPLTTNNIIHYYCPIIGTASYTLLSINVLNPMLRFSAFTKRDLTTILLLNSVVGAGCYIHSKRHMALMTRNHRLGFSAFGSVLFSFSSVLLWALLRSFLPQNLALCSTVGVATSYVFVEGATKYLEFVDSHIAP